MSKRKNIVLQVDNVSIKFNLSSEKQDFLKEYIVNIFRRKPARSEFWGAEKCQFYIKQRRPGGDPWFKRCREKVLC